MKKVLSILFALLILFSGMHFSIATHICRGEIAAVKLSFAAEKANCGMEQTENNCLLHEVIKSNCCHNLISFFAVDNNYHPSSFNIDNQNHNLLQKLFIPITLFVVSYTSIIINCTNVLPPGNMLASNVRLTNICIFRI